MSNKKYILYHTILYYNRYYMKCILIILEYFNYITAILSWNNKV